MVKAMQSDKGELLFGKHTNYTVLHPGVASFICMGE